MKSSSLGALVGLSVALGVFAPAAAFAQFSITNYQFVSEQRATLTTSAVTYRADLVNTGAAIPGVTATVTSLDLSSVRTVAGQDTLPFTAVAANSQVTSTNTFTILVDRTLPFNFNKLSWTFQLTNQPPPVANAGPNQTATVGATVTLNGGGSTNPSGAGTLSYSWAFTSIPLGSQAVLQHSTTVMPFFVTDVPGTYVITLTVSNGLASSAASVIVGSSCAPPVANAGPDQTTMPGTTVMLHGSGSTSACGNPLTYAWTMLTRPVGSTASLTAANTISPTFVADKTGTYTGQLIVNDGVNNSAPSVVTITELVKPVANAGPAQVVNVSAVVQLNGTGSTDANGLPLTYQWTFNTLPPGSAAASSSSTAVNPTFTADRPGTYVAQLIVNNGTFNSDPATIMITTQPVMQPTAIAGPNQTVNVGSTATLSGSGSDPQKLPLTYQWALINKPAGSAAALSSLVISNPTFVADLAGSYIAQLYVSNGFSSSTPVTVTISTTCSQPTANPGPNQNAAANSLVTLNGSGSGDACHDSMTYAWSFTTRAPGSSAVLSGANTVSPTFVPDVGGTYVAQLIVNNGFSNSNPATVTITVAYDILLPSNVTIAIDQQADYLVTLTNPAPAGGVFIALTSSDPSKVTISPSIFIVVGETAPRRPPTITGIANGSATITASASGLAPANQVVNVGAGATLSFSGSPLSVIMGATGNLTLMLSAAAPASGLTVNLNSSNPAAATVPAAVTIGAGATSVPVVVTAVGPGSTTITASAPGTSATATVNITQISIGVPANTVLNLDQSSAFPVTLTAPASSAVTVSLSSSDPSKVTVSPATVSIAAGATTPATQPQVTGAGVGSATITASAPNYALGTGAVTVNAPGLNFSGSPLSISVGSTGALNLIESPALIGDLIVNLSSSNPAAATVPATVTIPAGSASVPVPVTGVAQGSATITATVTGTAINLTATVNVSQLSISIASVPVVLGQSATLAVTLSAPAPAPVTINLSSSNPAKATVPASVFIPVGATTPATQPQVTGTGAGTATITGSATNYTSGAGTVTVSPMALSFTGPPLSIVQGTTGTLTLNLTSGPAPAGGLSVSLTSDNPAVAAVQANVTFAAGSTSVPVPVIGAAAGGPVTITASAPGIPSTTLTVTVTPAGPVMTISVDSASVGQNLQVPILIAISPAAPAGGLNLTVTSSDPTRLAIAALPTDAGSSQLSVSTRQGLTLQRIYAQGLTGSGTVTLTVSAPGYQNGQGVITLTPSGFILSAPGSASSFTTSVGASSPTTLTLNAVRLDSSLNVAEIQQVRGGFSTAVGIGNSNPSAGIVVSPVAFSGGNDTNTTTFTPTNSNLNAGNTTLTAITPVGSSTSNSGTTVMATVNQAMIVCTPVTVGQSLQATVSCTLNGGNPTAGLQVVLASADPAKLQFAALPVNGTSCTAMGSGSITLTTIKPQLGNPVIPVFCVYGLANSGSVNYSIAASGFVAGTGTVTLGSSGIIIAGPGGAGATSFVAFTANTTVSVLSALLDASGNYVTSQPIAAGFSASVTVTSSDPSVGTVPTSPLTIPAGAMGAATTFHEQPSGNGTTVLSVGTAPGFSVPASQYTMVTALVFPQKFALSCAGITVGKDLQSQCTVSIPTPAPAALPVTLTSANAGLLLSGSATTMGVGTLTVTIPAGGTVATYFAQALADAGTTSHTASSPGSGINDSDPAMVTLAPSGAVLSGLPFIFANAGGPLVPVTVALSVLNPADNTSTGNFEPLRGGLDPLSITLISSAPGVGTITSTVTIAAGTSNTAAQFTPLNVGNTTVSLNPAPGFTAASNNTSLLASVSP